MESATPAGKKELLLCCIMPNKIKKVPLVNLEFHRNQKSGLGWQSNCIPLLAIVEIAGYWWNIGGKTDTMEWFCMFLERDDWFRIGEYLWTLVSQQRFRDTFNKDLSKYNKNQSHLSEQKSCSGDTTGMLGRGNKPLTFYLPSTFQMVDKIMEWKMLN